MPNSYLDDDGFVEYDLEGRQRIDRATGRTYIEAVPNRRLPLAPGPPRRRRRPHNVPRPRRRPPPPGFVVKRSGTFPVRHMLVALVIMAVLAAWLEGRSIRMQTDKAHPATPAFQVKTLTPMNSPAERNAVETALLKSRSITLIKSNEWPKGTKAADKCYPEQDFPGGKVYYKIDNFLQEVAAAGFKVRISCIKTGHEKNKLLHPKLRAIDIDAVNGELVRPDSRQSAAFATWLKSRQDIQLPYEVGGPGTQIDANRLKRTGATRAGPFFTDSDHNNHWHCGFVPSDLNDPGYQKHPWM